jgi:hypothetical protein
LNTDIQIEKQLNEINLLSLEKSFKKILRLFR